MNDPRTEDEMIARAVRHDLRRHWTDAHIHRVEGGWAAFDEAGMEHGVYITKDEARDALVIYHAVYLSEAGRRHVAAAQAEALENVANYLRHTESAMILRRLARIKQGEVRSSQAGPEAGLPLP